jgi:ABC-type proline/glycine betaine transport system ATPase subunit
VPLLRRSISTLSGGQRQRVALARAIASDPDLLILDEPFSALDRFERDRQIRFVRSLTRELNLYLIVVTHDISEAAYLSDFLAIIDKGTVIARGSVGELLKNPGTVKVAQILGYENILSIVPRYPGRFDLADDAVEAGASKTSIVFKSSGNKVDSWVASSVSELSLRFDVIDDLVRLYGVCVIEDCIDLGNQKSVVLSIKKGPKIELDLGSTFSDDAVGVGTIVEVSVRLDPRSTSIL